MVLVAVFEAIAEVAAEIAVRVAAADFAEHVLRVFLHHPIELFAGMEEPSLEAEVFADLPREHAPAQPGQYGEQARVLKSIPGLENADILQYGQIHRNTFINSPKILNETLATKNESRLFFAGQITGVEVYVESVATGWLGQRPLDATTLRSLPCSRIWTTSRRVTFASAIVATAIPAVLRSKSSGRSTTIPVMAAMRTPRPRVRTARTRSPATAAL